MPGTIALRIDRFHSVLLSFAFVLQYGYSTRVVCAFHRRVNSLGGSSLQPSSSSNACAR